MDTQEVWRRLAMELDSLKLSTMLSDSQKMMSKDMEFIKKDTTGARMLSAIGGFATRASEYYFELSNRGEVSKQLTHKDPLVPWVPEGVEGGATLGNLTQVKFPMFNVAVQGKVDTGATTSSIDATSIQFNKQNNTVSFKSATLSQNVITLPVEGSQEVHSADHGGEARPIVRMDVEIGGVALKGALFNLNDRSNMDSKLLIGQNILKAGNFNVNVNKNPEQPDMKEAVQEEALVRDLSEHEELVQAVEILRTQKVTFDELFRYLTTEALLKVENLEQ